MKTLSFLVEKLLLKGKAKSEIFSIFQAKWDDARKADETLPETPPTRPQVNTALKECHQRWLSDAGIKNLKIATELRFLNDIYSKNMAINDSKAAMSVRQQIIELKEHPAFMSVRPRKKGRPTKYKDNFPARVKAFANEMRGDNFFSRCDVPSIAILLGVNTDTIYEWKKHHEQFSEAISYWKTRRDAIFWELASHSGYISDSKWIFLSKNFMGLHDKVAIENGHKKEGEKAEPFIVKIVKDREY